MDKLMPHQKKIVDEIRKNQQTFMGEPIVQSAEVVNDNGTPLQKIIVNIPARYVEVEKVISAITGAHVTVMQTIDQLAKQARRDLNHGRPTEALKQLDEIIRMLKS